MTKKNHIDYFLLFSFFALIFIGIIFLAGASAVPSQLKTGTSYYYLLRHLLFGILPGLILGVIAYNLKISFLKKHSFVFFLIGLFLLLLVFVPIIGIKSGGAMRWLNFYFFSIQPSEFLKISLILYFSSLFASYGSNKKKDKRSVVIPFLSIIFILSFVFIKQPDISTYAVILFTSLVIYFSSKSNFLIFLLTSVVILSISFSFLFLSDYRINRILVYLGFISDPLGLGFQAKQSIITIGSGGIYGLGMGNYNENFSFLPQTIGDSIFSVIASETGFIGALILLILFLLFFYRGVRVAEKAKDDFSSLVVIGISSWICIQAFINISAMIGIIPVTGIPMPFISYGGSHIISEMIAVGILLNVSKSK